MDRLQTFGSVRGFDIEAGQVTQVISSGDIARDGAIIDPSGWDFTNYDRNPVVLWMHDAAIMPFARTIEHLATETEVIAKAQFDLEDPFGVRLLAKISAGFVHATSVRWNPLKTEVRHVGEGKEARDVLVFSEQELLEWSYVTVPADPKALILRADGGPLDMAQWLPQTAEPEPEGIPIPQPDPYRIAEERVSSYIAGRLARPSVEDRIVAGLCKATGKSEGRIRDILAGGGT